MKYTHKKLLNDILHSTVDGVRQRTDSLPYVPRVATPSRERRGYADRECKRRARLSQFHLIERA